MPPIETMHRHDKAVLWEKVGNQPYDGTEPVLADAQEIMVRWEDEKREVPDTKESSIITDAMVVVAQDVPLGSILFLGGIDDYNSAPLELDGGSSTLELSQGGDFLLDTAGGGLGADLYQVVYREKIPDLKRRHFLRELGVVRYGDTLPELED